MAAGSASVSVTLPVTNAVDPNNVSRTLTAYALQAAAQAIQSNLAQTSGNILRPGDTPGAPVTIGTWTITPATT
jgi:hypothetical protein